MKSFRLVNNRFYKKGKKPANGIFSEIENNGISFKSHIKIPVPD